MMLDFPDGSDGKASVYNEGDLGSIPGSGRSAGEENGNPLQYSCLENLQGQRSLVGYSPWVCKESDMTEPLTLSLPFVTNFTSQIFFKSIAVSPLPAAHAVISFLGYFSSLWTHLLHPEVPPRVTPSPRESPSSAWSEVSVKFAK